MVNSTKDVLVTLLRDLTKRMQALSEDEFKDITSGAAQIDIKITSRRTKTVRVKKTPLTDSDMQQIMRALEKMETRTDGTNYLLEACMGKKGLAGFAKYIDIPIQKTDKVDRVIERIVEAMIGFRVRSEAIQGVKKDKTELVLPLIHKSKNQRA